MTNANDALLKAIEDDAFAESAALIKEAEDAASAVLREALSSVGEAREERLAGLSRGFEKRKASAVNNARVRVNALRLKARGDVIEEALSRVPGAIGRMPDAEYAAFLMRLFKELERAWKEGLDEEPVVLAGERDAALLSGMGIAARGDQSVSLGVAFASKDGRIRFENTVHSRLEKARGALVAELDRIIFG